MSDRRLIPGPVRQLVRAALEESPPPPDEAIVARAVQHPALRFYARPEQAVRRALRTERGEAV